MGADHYYQPGTLGETIAGTDSCYAINICRGTPMPNPLSAFKANNVLGTIIHELSHCSSHTADLAGPLGPVITGAVECRAHVKMSVAANNIAKTTSAVNADCYAVGLWHYIKDLVATQRIESPAINTPYDPSYRLSSNTITFNPNGDNHDTPDL